MSTSQPTTQPAAERRAAETQLANLITKLVPAHKRLIGTLRRKLRSCIPTAHEVVYEYRDCIVISYSPSGHGYEGVLALRASDDAVKLYFQQGKGLPDPEKLLQGSANARWMAIESASTLSAAPVIRLLAEAIIRSPVPFARTGRGSVVMSQSTVKKSAKRGSTTKKKAIRRARRKV